MASETAAVSEPALAVLMKTSKGWPPPFSLMVTKALPSGVSIVIGVAGQTRGRGFLPSMPDAAICVGERGLGRSRLASSSAVALVSSTTFSREPVT